MKAGGGQSEERSAFAFWPGEKTPTNFFEFFNRRILSPQRLSFFLERAQKNGPHDIAERTVWDVVEHSGAGIDARIEGASCPKGRERRVFHFARFFFPRFCREKMKK